MPRVKNPVIFNHWQSYFQMLYYKLRNIAATIVA